MAYGSALVDTIQSSTTGTPPQFNDGSGAQIGTLCRAWVNFNGVTTATIRASFNVSSVTRTATGNYTVNFATAFSDANYIVTATSGGSAARPTTSSTFTTTSALVTCSDSNTGAGYDQTYFSVAVFR